MFSLSFRRATITLRGFFVPRANQKLRNKGYFIAFRHVAPARQCKQLHAATSRQFQLLTARNVREWPK
jgi:hypothetical protein